ncbi:alanine racemase [Paroceanicella profunda]|uniref:Alanine racemase n=1 Tax=Paroceanicella profunda TaxID=2579971 RepID=A0A5B8FVC4_9RHOB|nr:alanine racemase [Paroceanicella profunda]QDL92385.1 alanine racemase [Paroceanicella profunda]
MAQAQLTVDIDAITSNWRALDALTASHVATAAVVKADCYGLGAARIAPALAAAGARTFCVAQAEEGAVVRTALRAAAGAEAAGAGSAEPEILVFGGYAGGEAPLFREYALTPLLNSPGQLRHFRAEMSGAPCGIQLDTGMNRLGFEGLELAQTLMEIMALRPRLVMSHLACADEPANPMSALQLAAFNTMTLALPGIRRSLSATGGTLLGPLYHFDMVRPGVGLYGGAPYMQAKPVVRLSLPVIQVRDVLPGEIVGYGGTYVAERPRRIATLSAGYADGLLRSLSGAATLHAGDTPCPLVGRVSMDLITVDVTGLDEVPATMDILGPHQGVDTLAAAAGTIGYEILTALGSRYARVYKGA